MKNDRKLADEIERYLGPDATYHHWDPSLEDMEQIIAALRRGPECVVYQCPRCATSMEVDPTAKPSPRPPSGEMTFVLKAARELSAFIKSHDYPEIGSADFVELTRLADVQDTELRALSAAEAEGRKG
jgi:hypothetical protein